MCPQSRQNTKFQQANIPRQILPIFSKVPRVCRESGILHMANITTTSPIVASLLKGKHSKFMCKRRKREKRNEAEIGFPISSFLRTVDTGTTFVLASRTNVQLWMQPLGPLCALLQDIVRMTVHTTGLIVGDSEDISERIYRKNSEHAGVPHTKQGAQ